MIPDTLLNDKTLTANEKLVLAFINSLLAKNKDCFISDRKLAKLLGITPCNANHIINSLISKNRITAQFSTKNGKYSERKLFLISDIKDTRGLDLETDRALRKVLNSFKL